VKTASFILFLAAGVAALVLSPSLQAEEGGTGHVAPGAVATMIDAPPSKSGWVIEAIYTRYTGGFDAIKELPIGGEISLGLDATADVLTVGALYTFKNELLGAHFSAGAFMPYIWLDVSGNVNQIERTDTAQGFSDITLIPVMLAWKEGFWEYSATLAVYAPTGEYNAGDLANVGLNYWTVDPGFGVSYNNDKTGFNFGAYAGITFNSENSATDYKSGSMFHLEGSVQQLLPLGKGYLGIGVDAFYFEQVSGDSGTGARRDFKGQTIGIGPVLDYILPVGQNTLVFEAKWLPELQVRNRIKGDYIWVKAAYQF